MATKKKPKPKPRRIPARKPRVAAHAPFGESAVEEQAAPAAALERPIPTVGQIVYLPFKVEYVCHDGPGGSPRTLRIVESDPPPHSPALRLERTADKLIPA